MTHHRFRAANWSALAAILGGLLTSAVCTRSGGLTAEANPPASRPAANVAPSPIVPPVRPQPAVAAAGITRTEPKLITPGDGPTFSIAFKHNPGDALYLTIENDYRDSGGVQPLLSYSTSIKERRFITQRVVATEDKEKKKNGSVPSMNSVASSPRIEWECDRYEAREKGMKEEAVFDSLRHLYPPPSLYNLGNIPGSKCSFSQDANGQVTNISIVPGASTGEPARGTASKTVEKCILTPENIIRQAGDMGPFYFPGRPVALGAHWTYSIIDVQRNVGTFTTAVKCSLRSVKEVEGRKIASIDIGGDTVLVAEKPPVPPTPTTRPGQSPAPASSGQREFKLDKALCNGQVEFDLTRGELVQMSLRREQGVAAELDGQALGPMRLKTSWEQVTKVTTSHQPSPKPVIVGGKIPPVIPKEDQSRTAIVRPPTTRPAMPTTRPAPPPFPRPGTPTSAATKLNIMKHPSPGGVPTKMVRPLDGGIDPPTSRPSLRPVTSRPQFPPPARPVRPASAPPTTRPSN